MPAPISIPYGAIKRLTGKNNYLKFSRISIPYGAIKSTHVPFGKTPNFSFQFLMVRLKANLLRCSRN